MVLRTERSYKLTCGCIIVHRSANTIPVNVTTLCPTHFMQGVVEEVTPDAVER